jgi:ParB/RepB/Spo0J family partition protein
MDAPRIALRYEPALPCRLIDVTQYRTRTQRNPAALAALHASIQQHGVLTPIWVQEPAPDADSFPLIAGFGRLDCQVSLGREFIPALVFSGNDSRTQCLGHGVIENCLREPLPWHMQADVIDEMAALEGLTLSKVAQRFGISQSLCSKLLGARARIAPDLQEPMAELGWGARIVDLYAKLTEAQQRETFASHVAEGWTADRLGNEVAKLRNKTIPASAMLRAVVRYVSSAKLNPERPFEALMERLQRLGKALRAFERKALPLNELDAYLRRLFNDDDEPPGAAGALVPA